jgi:hypothetical protein
MHKALGSSLSTTKTQNIILKENLPDDKGKHILHVIIKGTGFSHFWIHCVLRTFYEVYIGFQGKFFGPFSTEHLDHCLIHSKQSIITYQSKRELAGKVVMSRTSPINKGKSNVFT